MRKSITLLGLLVVVIVLGILTMIAIPNIKNIKSQSQLSNALENKVNVQKGIDRYFLEKQTFPCTTQPTAGSPQSIDWTKLEPPYLLKKPADLDKFYYWVDVFGTVWESDIDSPTNISTSGSGTTTVTFDEIANATSYQVGYIDQNAAFRVVKEINAGNNYTWKNSGPKANFTSTQVSGRNVLQTDLTDDLTGKHVVVNAISKNGLATAPVGTTYGGTPMIALNPTLAVSPSTGILDNTSITFTVTPPQGVTVSVYDWQVDNGTITNTAPNGVFVAGSHTIKVRLIDRNGHKSEWISNAITVTANITVKQIVAGDYQTLLLKTDGTLWTFGYNRFGQLGTATNSGTTNTNMTPMQVMTNVQLVAARGNTTFALKNDGTLWGFGKNDFGQLGIATNSGTTNPNPTPTQVMTNVKSVSVGNYQTFVIKNDDTLWSFGYNQYGQLGTTTNNNTTNPNPTPVQIMANVSLVSSGIGHTMVLKTDGTLWGFGYNQYGQLGTATNSNTANPNPTPVQVMTNVKTVSTGDYHTMVLKTDGTLWSFGNNQYGQLGIATNNNTSNPNPTPAQSMTNVQSVNTGASSTLIVKNDATLWGFGNNCYGQLGISNNNGTNDPLSTPTQIYSNVATVISGGTYSFLITTDSKVLSFGQNNFGQLSTNNNIGTTIANPTPTQITIP